MEYFLSNLIITLLDFIGKMKDNMLERIHQIGRAHV